MSKVKTARLPPKIVNIAINGLDSKSTVLARIVIGLRAAGLTVNFDNHLHKTDIEDTIRRERFLNGEDFTAPVLLITSIN